jgi:hypothetical protein
MPATFTYEEATTPQEKSFSYNEAKQPKSFSYEEAVDPDFASSKRARVPSIADTTSQLRPAQERAINAPTPEPPLSELPSTIGSTLKDIAAAQLRPIGPDQPSPTRGLSDQEVKNLPTLAKAGIVATTAAQGVGDVLRTPFTYETLGLGPLVEGIFGASKAPYIQKALSAAFAGQMTASGAQKAGELVTELKKPKSQQDTKKILALGGGLIVDAAFTGAAGAHAALPIQTKPLPLEESQKGAENAQPKPAQAPTQGQSPDAIPVQAQEPQPASPIPPEQVGPREESLGPPRTATPEVKPVGATPTPEATPAIAKALAAQVETRTPAVILKSLGWTPEQIETLKPSERIKASIAKQPPPAAAPAVEPGLSPEIGIEEQVKKGTSISAKDVEDNGLEDQLSEKYGYVKDGDVYRQKSEAGKAVAMSKEEATLKKLGVTDYDDLDIKANAKKLTPAQVRQAKKALDTLAAKSPPEPEKPIVSMGGQNPSDPGEIPQSNLASLGSSLKTLADQSTKPEVSKAFSIGESLAPIKNGVSNTLQGLKAVGSYLKTKLEGYPKFDSFMGLIGDRHLALSESALDARRFMKDSMKAIPDALTREAISNWVDAGGDEAKLREGLSQTKDRYKPGYEAALKLTPEQKVIAKNIQNYFEARLQDAIDAGILEDGIEDYIHRYYEKDSPWKQSILNELRSGIFTGQPALAKKRIFSYDYEAESAGYKPIKDFAKRVVAYDLALNKAIADRQLVKGLMQMKTPDGEPWVSVGGVATKIGGEGTDGALLVKPTIKPEKVGEYRYFDHPALRKWKWVAEDSEGKPVLVQGSVLIHPDALPKVKALFERSAIRQHPVGRAMLNLGSTVKQTMLDLSGFHQVQMAIHGAEHQRLKTFSDFKGIDLTDADQRGLVRGGMVIGDTTGRQHFDEGLVGSSLSKHLPFGIGERVNQYKEYLFGDFIPRLKMKTGLMALDRNRQLFPNLSEQEVYHLTANQMNAAFGELNYAMLGRSATMQDAMRLVMLSPDFTEARARFVGQAATKYGGRPIVENGKLKVGEQGKALLIGAAALYVTARIINKLLNGEYHFERENAFNVLHGGKAYSLRTVQGDVLKAATEPEQFIRNRLNPVYGRTAEELTTGRDYFGRKRNAAQQAKDLAETVVPISLRGLLSGREQSLMESLMNSMGVTEHRDSPTQRIAQLAEDWKTKNKVYGEPGEFIYDPDKDKFRGVTLAARYDDVPAVRSEILKAEKQGASAGQILKHYQLSAKHLFTGSTKANEERFKASLSKDERKQYDDAIKERNDIAAKVFKAVP